MERTLLVLAFLFLLVPGCSSNEDESIREGPGRGHVWEGQMGVLDKTRAVEETMKDAAEEQRRRLKQQTQ